MFNGAIATKKPLNSRNTVSRLAIFQTVLLFGASAVYLSLSKTEEARM
jgi:hypothetical protein